MKKHALDLVVGHFVKVIKTGVEGLTKHYPGPTGWGVGYCAGLTTPPC